MVSTVFLFLFCKLSFDTNLTRSHNKTRCSKSGNILSMFHTMVSRGYTIFLIPFTVILYQMTSIGAAESGAEITSLPGRAQHSSTLSNTLASPRWSQNISASDETETPSSLDPWEALQRGTLPTWVKVWFWSNQPSKNKYNLNGCIGYQSVKENGISQTISCWERKSMVQSKQKCLEMFSVWKRLTTSPWWPGLRLFLECLDVYITITL